MALAAAAVFVIAAITTGHDSPAAHPVPTTDVTSTPTSAPTTMPTPDITARVVVVHDAAPASSACGSVVPIELEVLNATAVDGPAPGDSIPSPAAGQFVRHWNADGYTVELRWPPDPRELEDSRPTVPDLLVGGWGSGSLFSITVTSPSNDRNPPVLYTVSTSPNTTFHEQPWNCSLAQVRLMSDDGRVETYGYRLPFISNPDPTVDLGPLVRIHRESLAAAPVDRPTICSDPNAASVQDLVRVEGEPSSNSPVEALRWFLDDEVSADVPRPTSGRPFEETHFVQDGSYRYEQYTAWFDYVTITVEPLAGGWAVTAWQRGTC